MWVLTESNQPAADKKPLELRFPTPESVQIDGRTYPLNQRIQTPVGWLRVLTRKPVGPQTEPVLVQLLWVFKDLLWE